MREHAPLDVRAEWLTITPAIAAKMLETMNRNRKVSERHVTQLAELMQAGQWREDAGDPIRFDKRDILWTGSIGCGRLLSLA